MSDLVALINDGWDQTEEFEERLSRFFEGGDDMVDCLPADVRLRLLATLERMRRSAAQWQAMLDAHPARLDD